MKQNNISFMLSIVAGVVCLGAFAYKYLKFNEIDTLTLIAGIFILAFGFGMRYMRRK